MKTRNDNLQWLKSIDNQRGATLVIALVILVVMTFLGLGAMSDSNLQLAMVRNHQLQASSYTAALTEINAQIDSINANAAGALDQVVLDVVQAQENGDGEKVINPTQLLTAIDQRASTTFDTTLTLTEPNPGIFIPMPNFSLSSDSPVKFLFMDFNSIAEVKHTNTRSDQVQGFTYLSAN